MESREIVFRLLYLALIEIRAEAHETKNFRVFHLADLFHNIPLQMEKTAKESGNYDEILEWVYNRAIEKKCEKWLENALKNNIGCS